ncbi:MAG: methyl-accepting chemotaxis protein [Aquabacterium sp.]|nr:methyl-accepting chemotaxis protein [Aquabacterium sp.]
MRVNTPVTQRERDWPADWTLVSTTDTQGRITHCNRAFIEVSGFDYDELMGQPHNIVRHPDMPPEAFRDMWATIGHGRPWSGVIKNRCKDGDHYWVLAHVTPVLDGGKPKGYVSVRLKPTREQVSAAEALYARIAQERDSGRRTIKLHAGDVRRIGWRDWPHRIHRLTLSQRVGLMMGSCVGVLAGMTAAGVNAWVSTGVMAALLGGFAWWFYRDIGLALHQASRIAAQVAGCNLNGTVAYDDMRHPLGRLLRRLWLINLNMRAVVEDVRAEVGSMAAFSREIAQGSRSLSDRTEQQSCDVQRTASAMEQMTSAVRQTADHAHEVAQLTETATRVAGQGGQAVGEIVGTMDDIEATSRRVAEIIGVIEGIAFQTNILALNAAVEAARAGEQGRGFAVVATEVRALAHRVGDAAKEVRELVGASVEQVAGGSRRVRAAEAIIAELVGSVNQVSGLVAQISGAAREQSRGIADVNGAVSSIDATTQQNAALAEQTAAASGSLEIRAATLMRAVQIFRVQ